MRDIRVTLSTIVLTSHSFPTPNRHESTTQKWSLCPCRGNSRPRTRQSSRRHQGLVGRSGWNWLRTASVAAFHQPCFSDTSLYPVKNVVLTGFGHITLLDLDTIDLSNLNRQFLFKKKDVKQSKAMVRATRLLQVPAHSGLYSYHYLHLRWQPKPPALSTHMCEFNRFTRISRSPNSMSSGSNPLTLSSTPSTTSVSRSAFQLACCATCCGLDARRHVNKMCMAGGIPLVESGTAGYLGQVQPLLKVRLSFRRSRHYLPWYRTGQSVLIVYPSRPQSRFPCAPSDRLLPNLFTVSSGPRVIFFRTFMYRDVIRVTDGRKDNYSGKTRTGVRN